jgi:hypothetical protein
MTIAWAIIISVVLFTFVKASKDTQKSIGKIVAWVVGVGFVLTAGAYAILLFVDYQGSKAKHDYFWKHYIGYRLVAESLPQDPSIMVDQKKFSWWSYKETLCTTAGYPGYAACPQQEYIVNGVVSPDPWVVISENPAPPLPPGYSGPSITVTPDPLPKKPKKAPPTLAEVRVKALTSVDLYTLRGGVMKCGEIKLNETAVLLSEDHDYIQIKTDGGIIGWSMPAFFEVAQPTKPSPSTSRETPHVNITAQFGTPPKDKCVTPGLTDAQIKALHCSY